MQLAKTLKSRRTALGYTLKEIAVKMNVSEATVQRWESGNIKNLRHGRIVKLAEILDVSPAELMGWDNANSFAKDIKISQEASKKLDALLAMVDELTDDEWNKLIDYGELLVSSHKNHTDEK